MGFSLKSSLSTFIKVIASTTTQKIKNNPAKLGRKCHSSILYKIDQCFSNRSTLVQPNPLLLRCYHYWSAVMTCLSPYNLNPSRLIHQRETSLSSVGQRRGGKLGHSQRHDAHVTYISTLILRNVALWITSIWPASRNFKRNGMFGGYRFRKNSASVGPGMDNVIIYLNTAKICQGSYWTYIVQFVLITITITLL